MPESICIGIGFADRVDRRPFSTRVGDTDGSGDDCSGFAAGDEVNFDEVGIVIKLYDDNGGVDDYATGGVARMLGE